MPTNRFIEDPKETIAWSDGSPICDVEGNELHLYKVLEWYVHNEGNNQALDAAVVKIGDFTTNIHGCLHTSFLMGPNQKEHGKKWGAIQGRVEAYKNNGVLEERLPDIDFSGAPKAKTSPAPRNDTLAGGPG